MLAPFHWTFDVMKRIAICTLLLVMMTAAQAESPSAVARTLILVRHGNYVADPAADKQRGPGLSPIGVAQARLAGARLSAMPAGFDALHASPLQRARDTAAIIAGSFPGRHFDVLPDLEECTPPTRRTEITKDDKPEQLTACKAQLDRLFSRHFKPAQGKPQTELFVCHGNVIRYLVTRALGVDSTAWLEMSVGHASFTQIRVEADGHFKVIAVGDVGHLPPNLLTGATGDPHRDLTIPSLPVEDTPSD
jgi:serine/threonine-protein phosphatase PGAM5